MPDEYVPEYPISCLILPELTTEPVSVLIEAKSPCPLTVDVAPTTLNAASYVVVVLIATLPCKAILE